MDEYIFQLTFKNDEPFPTVYEMYQTNMPKDELNLQVEAFETAVKEGRITPVDMRSNIRTVIILLGYTCKPVKAEKEYVVNV